MSTTTYAAVGRFPVFSPADSYSQSSLGYILGLAGSADGRYIAASGQKSRGSNYIAVIDQETLQFVTFLGPDNLAHGATITDLVPIESSIFGSTGRDGWVRLFDVRQGNSKPVWGVRLLHKDDEAELNSVAFNGSRTLAVSGGSEIFLFDFRSQKNREPYFNYNELHAEPITKLRFSGATLLVSGSEDGMLAVVDTENLVNEDDGQAPVVAINTGNGVRDFRIMSCGTHVCSFSPTESMAIWNLQTGLLAASIENGIRDHPLVTTPGEDEHGGSLGYIVDVFGGNAISGTGPTVLAGNSDGQLVTLNAADLSLNAFFTPGHSAVVRCSWTSPGRGLFTGGEDGAVLLWREASGGALDATTGSPGGAFSDGRRTPVLSPY